MPTDVRIQGVTCRIDEEQDPTVWVCDYRVQEVLSGDIVTPQIENLIGDPPEDALDIWVQAEDYVLV